MSKYEVVEKFVSINGEGTKAGQLAVFIRFKGCNLKCKYCDTKWANEQDTLYQPMTEEEILDYVLSTGVKNVTLTGGEPLLRDDIEKVITALAENNLNVEIETNGSIFLDKIRKLHKENVTFTMDYKISCSGMEQSMNLGNFDILKEIIEKYKATTTSTTNNIVINLVDDKHLNPKPKSIRINEFVYQDWQKFCDENKLYSKQELISMALKEYMENHVK